MLKNFLAAFLFVAVIFFPATSNAEIETFVGTGEHYLSKSDTLQDGKEQAKLLAELDVAEQVAIQIQSISELKNLKLTKDEIITISAALMNVLDIKYSIRQDFDGVLIIAATVTAEVDTEKVPELVEREVNRRMNRK